MAKYIDYEDAICMVDYAADEHPYSKERNKPETYSDYNQGWSDACDYIRGKLESIKIAEVAPKPKNGTKYLNRAKLIDFLYQELNGTNAEKVSWEFAEGYEVAIEDVRKFECVFMEDKECDKVEAMTFDELLDNLAAELPEYKETIQASKLIADKITEFIRENDMVGVVRCKDCKHSEDFPHGTREKRYCNLHDTTMCENDFCSRGEGNDNCNMYDVSAKEITKENI